MNAGLATAAPLPLPTGPQTSVAPGASTAVTKPAGEAFSLHLAKAIAEKTPAKPVTTQQPSDQIDPSTSELPARVAKADDIDPKTKSKDLAPTQDVAPAPVASLNGSDQAALAFVAIPMAIQSETPAAKVDVTANLQVTSEAPLIEATKGSNALAKVALNPSEPESPKTTQVAELETATPYLAQQAIAQAALAPDTLPAQKADIPQSSPAQVAKPATPLSEQAKASRSQVIAAQATSPEGVQVALPVADKSSPPSVSKSKSAVLTTDARVSQSEAATASILFTPPAGEVLASSPKSGGGDTLAKVSPSFSGTETARAGISTDLVTAQPQPVQTTIATASKADQPQTPPTQVGQMAQSATTLAEQVQAGLRATTTDPQTEPATISNDLGAVTLKSPEPEPSKTAQIAELVTATPSLAKQVIAQASVVPDTLPASKPDQPQTPPTQVAQMAGSSPEQTPATPLVAAKSSLPSASKVKTAGQTNDSRVSKSDVATASTLPNPPAGMIATSSTKSGGNGAGSGAPGHEFESSAARSQSMEGASAQASSSDVPQPLLQATVHIAPQTLQSAGSIVRSGPQTLAGLAAQIVSKFDGKTTRFDVELHPLDLGRVDVRLEVGAGGQISAAMSFDNPQAAADMRARSADLQKALENAGFNLSGGLSFDVAGDRGQGGGRNSGAEPGPAQRVRALETATNAAAEAADLVMTNLMSAYGARPSRSVDIRI